jgi:hypothetical protein
VYTKLVSAMSSLVAHLIGGVVVESDLVEQPLLGIIQRDPWLRNFLGPFRGVSPIIHQTDVLDFDGVARDSITRWYSGSCG